MPTAKQDRDFAEAIVSPSMLLENAIEWIVRNLEPEDVFSETVLEKWAEANGYVKASE